jgi:hypothetical protein
MSGSIVTEAVVLVLRLRWQAIIRAVDRPQSDR